MRDSGTDGQSRAAGAGAIISAGRLDVGYLKLRTLMMPSRRRSDKKKKPDDGIFNLTTAGAPRFTAAAPARIVAADRAEFAP
jgi:hypothetical protein